MRNLIKVATVLVIIGVTATVIRDIKRNKTNANLDGDIAKTTAMITNLNGNSGGTGVVLKSENTQSTILTNAHVCGVVKNGGMVTTDNKRALVTSYKVSEMHDLCLITVNNNLNINTKVATEAPKIYSSSVVAGHPGLLPTIVNRGHFGDHEVITIMVGIRECKQEDLDSELGIVCMFLGGIPILKNYEAQVVSNTIMPGSSGSAVFDSNGNIAGLVFAGSGQLSYGHIVPQEYVQNFIEQEVDMLKEQKPTTELSLKELKAKNVLLETCKEGKLNANYNIVKKYCNYVEMDFIVQ